MRPCQFISTIFIATLFFGFKPLTYPVEITGHIKKNPKDTSAYIEHLTVFVKGDKKILAKTLTDNRGNFRLSFTPMKEKSFDFFCTGIGIDTLLIKSVTTFDSDEVEMTFYVPGEVKTNAFGKIICPKCKRTDKVYPIEYGFPTYVSYVDKNGDTTFSSIYKGKYQAGNCSVTPAKYYCDRDKIKF
jgi:hypothetical protein